MTHRGQFLWCSITLNKLSFAEDTVGTWLTVAPDVFFLVTSRQSLGVDGEVVVDVPPCQPGCRGLIRRACKSREAGFLVREEHREILSDIVDRLDTVGDTFGRRPQS